MKDSVNFKFDPEAAAAAIITAGTFAVRMPVQLSFFPLQSRISDRRETTSVVF